MTTADPVATKAEPAKDAVRVRAVTLSLELNDARIGNRELWQALHTSWDAVQRAANAAMRAYFLGDEASLETSAKGKRKFAGPVPGAASNDAYAQARQAAPELSSSPVADVCQRVRGRYMHDRWAVRAVVRKSLPTFRRPLPLSIRKKDWQLLVAEGSKGRAEYFIRFPLLQYLRDDRPTLRLILRTGRDAALLGKIASGEYTYRTLEILPAGWERKGGPRVKIVYEVPIIERAREATGTLEVRTGGREHLLIAKAGESVHHWNADWLRSKIIAYENWRQRASEDHKHERRVPRSRREVDEAGITIYNGDCREILPQLSFDSIVTDPGRWRCCYWPPRCSMRR